MGKTIVAKPAPMTINQEVAAITTVVVAADNNPIATP